VIGESGDRVIGKAGDTSSMSEMSTVECLVRVPEARYAYYRRCQVFRRNGEQCKAPAEKGAQICHAHYGQMAMAVRRERARRAVLAEAVAEMRRKGKPECEMADLFMDFKGIQVTLAVMAQALIDGRIDCKTAGQMVVHLQMMSKLLRMLHRQGTSTTETRRHGESQILPQICADERRSNRNEKLPEATRRENGLTSEKALTTKDTRSAPLSQAQGRSGQAMEHERPTGIGSEQGRPASIAKAEVQKICGERLSRHSAGAVKIAVVKRAMEASAEMERAQGSWEEARAA
jgi:hypothetical protein